VTELETTLPEEIGMKDTPIDGENVNRRSFFGKLAGLAAAPFLINSWLSRKARAGALDVPFTDLQETRGSYWREDGKYFVQENVDASKLDQGVIRARVDGRWNDFAIRNMTDHFFDYNIAMRMKMIDVMLGMGELSIYNDAHNAAVASYGANRGDSRFSINNAFKGLGWVPRQSVINDMADEYYAHSNDDMMSKIQIIKGNYGKSNHWRRDVIGSHELYTHKDFETHTFLNVMENPVVSICTLGDESYEFRAICRLLHPENPDLSEDDWNIVRWVNYAHDFFHGSTTPNLSAHRIVTLYHVVEMFDNSPMGGTPKAGGLKLVPGM